MARKATGAKRLGAATLTAGDWAEAALELIAEQGLGGLSVAALADRLGVTKGSFYWHFQGRADLLGAALARWEQQAGADATRFEAVTDDRRRLTLMLDVAAMTSESRSLYAALAEAAEDPLVRRVLNRVATSRIAGLERCYANLGLSRARARAHAVFAYAAYRGLLQVAHDAPAVVSHDWSAYRDLLIALIPKSRLRRR